MMVASIRRPLPKVDDTSRACLNQLAFLTLLLTAEGRTHLIKRKRSQFGGLQHICVDGFPEPAVMRRRYSSVAHRTVDTSAEAWIE